MLAQFQRRRREGVGPTGASHEMRTIGRSESLPNPPQSPQVRALPTPRDEPAPAPDTVLARRARVLVVEDDVDVADSLGMILELLGHHVWIVHDGLATLEAACADRFDVVLLDIGLPGIDGYEVARRMREELRLTTVTLVALTGYGREEDKQRAFAVGFDYHLVKPIDPDALEALLGRLAAREEARTV